MKVALVHDWLTRLGGAERVLFDLHKIFLDAPIYTLFYDKKFTSQYLAKAKIISSFLQQIPNIKKLHPWFKIFMPLATESFDFSGFDLVISSSHEFSHGVLVRQGTKHICFYHSPSRILWDRTHEYVNDFRERGRGSFKLSLIRLGQHFLRIWDWSAAKRPDIILANSKYVAGRIKKYYGREAKVIYPPVASWEYPARSFSGAPAAPSDSDSATRLRRGGTFDEKVVGRFVSLRENQTKTASESAHLTFPTGYFLIVSQLYPHKNINLAVQAFKSLPELNLLIIGEGPENKRLQKLIGDSPNIKLLGFVLDDFLATYYQNCLAYLICNEEDFGISPLEAMSFGKPVLALRKGGATETVLESITGEFFDKPEINYLTDAIRVIDQKIKENYYSEAVIKKHSEKFGFERFKREIFDLVKDLNYNN